ncbi:hypothetical protein AAC387_Pa07g1704 [Persea americana]
MVMVDGSDCSFGNFMIAEKDEISMESEVVNQLEILPPAVLDGVQTLDHETDNEEDVKIKAVEKETKAEQGERKTEEHLNEPKVETRNDEAKNSGAVPMGFETARSPEKRDDGLTPPSLEKGCNYAKGRWVAESRQPLYSGFGGKDGPEVVDVGSEYGLVKAAATDYAMHLDRPPAFLQHYLHRFNVLVLNTGHHWNRGKLNVNRWVMYVGGEPIRGRKLAEIGNAKNFAVYSVIKWLDSQLPHHPQLKAFFRTISPRHFSNGDWNTGGRCDNTIPLAGGDKVSQDESVVAGAVKGTGVRLLDITALSQLREEGHISQYSLKASDGVQHCLHWCLPVGEPSPTNKRYNAAKIFSHPDVIAEEPRCGIEQVHTLLQKDVKRPIGWPMGGYPRPQAPAASTSVASMEK